MSSRRSTNSSKGELDVAIIDDWTLNVSGLLDQLDHDLEQAKIGSGRIEPLVAALKLASEKVNHTHFVRATILNNLSNREVRR